VYHLLLFFHVRLAYQPTGTGVSRFHKKAGDPWHELTSTILSVFHHRFARNMARYVGIPTSCSCVVVDFLNDFYACNVRLHIFLFMEATPLC
jgi:hypothetical protein